MLEGILNSGDQAMNLPPPPSMPDQNQAPNIPAQGGPPSAGVSFDVNKNPQDMQFMTDAMMYAPMLQQMSPEQRQQKWPQIVDSLNQVSPKAGAMLDPSLPPSDADLSAINKSIQPKNIQLANSSDDYNTDQVKRQLQGQPPQSRADWIAEQVAKQKQAATDPHNMNAMNDTNFLYEAGKVAGRALGAVGNAVGNAIFPTAQAGSILEPSAPSEDPRQKGAEAGKYLKDAGNAAAGEAVIPGGSADKPYDNKNDPKISNMLLACKQQIPNIQQLLLDGQGGVNRNNITGMDIHQPGRLPGVGSVSGVTNEDASQLSKSFEVCVQGLLRSEYPNRLPSPDIIKQVRDLYKPSSTDSDDEVYQKMFLMKAKVNGYLSQITEIDSHGDQKFNEVKAQAEMSSMQNELYSYKKEWVKQALADPRNQAAGMTPNDAGRLFNQKMAVDGDFVRNISEKVKNDPNRPSKEMQ